MVASLEVTASPMQSSAFSTAWPSSSDRRGWTMKNDGGSRLGWVGARVAAPAGAAPPNGAPALRHWRPTTTTTTTTSTLHVPPRG